MTIARSVASSIVRSVASSVTVGGSSGDPSLLAEYKFNEGSGTTLVDSVSGQNGTITNGSWSGGGLVFNGTAFVTLNNALLRNAKTVQLFLSRGLSSDSNAFFGSTSGPSEKNFVRFLSSPSDSCQLRLVGSSAFQTYVATQCPWGPTLVTAVYDTLQKVYFNTTEADYYYNQQAPSAEVAAGNLLLGKGYQGLFTGTMYYALIYNRVLSQQEISANYTRVAAVLTSRGVSLSGANPATYSGLVLIGDSLTAGLTAASIPTTRTYQRYNFGIGGQLISEIAARTSVANALYKPSAPRNILHLWAGTNDANAATFDNLKAATALFKAAGHTVIVATMISRGSGLDTFKNSYNAQILDPTTGWSSFADGVNDMTGIAELSADGAFANTTYFTDGTHQTAAGKTLVQNAIGAAVDAFG